MVQMGGHVWSGSADKQILAWSSAGQQLYSVGDQGGYLVFMYRIG